MKKRMRPILSLPACCLAYLYVWVTLDFPRFYHNSRRPFILDAEFIDPFLRYVAGPMDCLAALVVQLYYYPWLGALTVLSILATIYAATMAVLQAFGRPSRLVSLLPAALGLLLLQQHITAFPLLSFAFSLCMTALFIRCNSLPLMVRFAIFTALSAVTCYVAGGTALLLAATCALNELLLQKQRVLAVAYLVLGALIPYAIGGALFEPDRAFQYFVGAPVEEISADLHPLEIAWYALCPVAIVVTVYAKRLRPYATHALRLSCIAALALMCLVMVTFRLSRGAPEAYLHFYAENGEWEKALDYAQRSSAHATLMTAHIVNQALYHTGRLPHDMFDYPQLRNEDVLLLGDVKLPGHENRRSDVYYHLGRIGQAEMWAHEVLTHQGCHGSALRRLISINVLRNRPKTARVYAGVMRKTVTHRNLAAELIAQFERGELLAADAEINGIRPLLPKSDYAGEWTTPEILTQQLHEAPNNRMAFEYLMAHFLITGNIEGFGQHVHRIEAFGYRELPRAYEEACLYYMMVAGRAPPGLALKAREDSARKFGRFKELFLRHERERRELWSALKPEFGNTFWFFDVFGRSGAVRPPDFDRKR